jgi:N-acetyl-gamma-glutamyl-phosphate reductase
VPGARVVANPGCYPTATLLALAPALQADLVEDDLIVDAKSGVSGAGHNVDDAYLFGTIDESVRPYGVPHHRHAPEIAQEVRGMSGRAPRLTFTPHLIPMTRGLIATCYATLRDGVDAARVADAYATAYAEEPFVRVTSSYPATKATLGSNWCLVHAVVDEPNRRLVAFGVLDNLVKGAAGSAIQNLNAMRGFPETMGLEALPLWP